MKHKVKIRNIACFNDKHANNVIRKATSKLDLESGNESVVLLNTSTYEVIGPCLSNNAHAVRFSSTMRELLHKEPITSRYALIHNHPNCSSFSIRDMETFLRIPSLYLMLAVGNDGNHYYAMLKVNVKDEEAFELYYRLKNREQVDPMYGHRSFRCISKELASLGMWYREFMYDKNTKFDSLRNKLKRKTL